MEVPAASPTAVSPIDTLDRQDVVAAFWSVYDPGIAVSIDWNGDIDMCSPGSTSRGDRSFICSLFVCGITEEE